MSTTVNSSSKGIHKKGSNTISTKTKRARDLKDASDKGKALLDDLFTTLAPPSGKKAKQGSSSHNDNKDSDIVQLHNPVQSQSQSQSQTKSQSKDKGKGKDITSKKDRKDKSSETRLRML